MGSVEASDVFLIVLLRLVFGLENGLVVVDYLSQFILMNMATADLYGTMDPFQRATQSPKRRGPANDNNPDDPAIFPYDQVTLFRHQMSIIASVKLRSIWIHTLDGFSICLCLAFIFNT